MTTPANTPTSRPNSAPSSERNGQEKNEAAIKTDTQKLVIPKIDLSPVKTEEGK